MPEKKNDGVEVTAVFTDRCWTEVKADGKTVFEGTVEKGKTESWKGREKVVITAGNAGAVELKLNGKELGKAGKTGQVVEKTYTPDGEVSADQGRKDSKNHEWILPISRQDMAERGYEQLDFIFISGDAYVDHPSFGPAILCRLLENMVIKSGSYPSRTGILPGILIAWENQGWGFLFQQGIWIPC